MLPGQDQAHVASLEPMIIGCEHDETFDDFNLIDIASFSVRHAMRASRHTQRRPCNAGALSATLNPGHIPIARNKLQETDVRSNAVIMR